MLPVNPYFRSKSSHIQRALAEDESSSSSQSSREDLPLLIKLKGEVNEPSRPPRVSLSRYPLPGLSEVVGKKAENIIKEFHDFRIV